MMTFPEFLEKCQEIDPEVFAVRLECSRWPAAPDRPLYEMWAMDGSDLWFSRRTGNSIDELMQGILSDLREGE